MTKKMHFPMRNDEVFVVAAAAEYIDNDVLLILHILLYMMPDYLTLSISPSCECVCVSIDEWDEFGTGDM